MDPCLRRAFRALIFLCLAFLLQGCGTKRNTPLSRNWQAFTTRYNVYFNGSEHLKEQLATMEDTYEDDFTRRLPVHPAEARADSRRPQPAGDFRRTIEKMQKAIQLHSITRKPRRRGSSAEEKAFREREEFNPFLHNAWMMMGEAQYLNGDFTGAATTFLYISRHFRWLPEVVTEARLRQALCYCALDLVYEAENVLHTVREKDLTDPQLRRLYDLAMADCLLRASDDAGAAPYLVRAAGATKGRQGHRLWFLTGQVYAALGERGKAFEAFRKAGSGISTPYSMKFNARIKESEVFPGTDITKEVESLRKMTRYERNRALLDRIYYAIGNLYMSRADTLDAMRNYRLAVERSESSGIDRALARLALGNILFSRGEYVEAQPCYAEAVPLLPDNYPGYKEIRLRSDVLDELALYAGNVELQDSLLRLARMPREEQLAVCRRMVDELLAREKAEREQAAREAFVADMEEKEAGKATAAPAVVPAMSGADKSWYFYNRAVREAGRAEFQRRWGARRLEDDWRRRDKNTFTLADDHSDGTDSEVGSDDVSRDDSVRRVPAADDPHEIEYYMSRIPSDPAQIRAAREIVQEGLYNMGLILKDRLGDYRAARMAFSRLDREYPDNVYRLDVYYNMYLMAVREDDESLAEQWRDRILADFPDSPYGRAMADPSYFSNLRRMHEVQEEMYADAYSAYLADDNRKVRELTEKMETDYPLSPILPKFIFIDALSALTEGETSRFRDRLRELLVRWPDTDMTPMASGILRRLDRGMEPHAGLSNSHGIIWQTRLATDSAGVAAPDSLHFSRDPGSPQCLVLAFPRDSVNANLVLYEVARFNFSSFVVRDFDLEPMSFSDIGLLVIKGFRDLRDVERYRKALAASDVRLPSAVRPIVISAEDFSILLREGRSFDDYFRFCEERDIGEAERAVEERAGVQKVESRQFDE